MADLATLQIAVDSRPVAKASNDLDELGRSAKAAENASYTLSNSQRNLQAAFATSNKAVIDATKYINQLQDETRRLSSSAYELKQYEIAMAAAAAPTVELKNQVRAAGAEMLRAMQAADSHTGAINAMTPRTRLASHEVLQLSYNVQDLAVQLLSGSPPMMAFAQQGSQIAGSMQASELGVKGFIKAVGLMIVDVTKAMAVNPIFLGIAAAVATVSAAVNFMADDITKSSGVTVTAGDVIMGTFDALGAGIMNFVNSGLKALGAEFGITWDNIVEYTRKGVNIVIGLVTLFPRTMIAAWEVLPTAVADIFYSTTNYVIQAMNNQIAKATALLNMFISGANSLLGAAGIEIPTLSAPQIATLENSYAGAAKRAMTAFVNVGIETFKTDYIGKMASVIEDAAVKRAHEDSSKKAGKDAGAAAGKAAAEEFAKMFADALQSVSLQMGGFQPLIPDEGIDDILAKQAEERNKAYREQQKALQENADFATKVATEIGGLIGGAFGTGVKDLAAVLTKEFPALMASLGGTFKGFETSINNVLSSLGTSLKELGAYAGVGGAAAAATGGSQLGGSVGGAVGGVLGEGIKFLGKFGGPIGSIAGGILGGIIGGLFKKTKQASATIEAAAGSLNVAGIVGNDTRFKAAVSGLAKSVIGGIDKIAQALGAEIEGAFKMSIGQRDKKFVVDPFGMGRTKGSGTISFETEAEAIAYAIDSAIRGGILGGLRSGTQALLRGAGDLEDRLQKALDFESVFKSLAAETNPLGAALEAVDKRFKALILTFQEAGASSEEWAQLEKYYQLEREKAIREGNAKAIEAVNAARDQLTEAYNRESEAIMTTLERFKNLTADLESFRLSLAEQLMTAEEIYKTAKDRFDEVAKLAVEGNEKAISDLVAVSQKYLDAARNFLTPEEYNREIQNVMKAVDLAIVQTKTMEDYAQLQLDALNNSVDGLITLNDSVLSVKDAISALAEAQSRVQTAPATTLVFSAPASNLPDFGSMSQEQIVAWAQSQGYMSGGGGGYSGYDSNANPAFANGGIHTGGVRLVGENGPELEVTGPSRIYNANQTAAILNGGAGVEQQIANLREEMRASLYAIAKNTGKTSDQLQRWDGDGMPEVRDWTA